jgi:hypothetical protein
MVQWVFVFCWRNSIGQAGWIEDAPEEEHSAAFAVVDQIDEWPVGAKGRGERDLFPRNRLFFSVSDHALIEFPSACQGSIWK